MCSYPLYSKITVSTTYQTNESWRNENEIYIYERERKKSTYLRTQINFESLEVV